jgi:hypothetical protein
MLEINLHKRYNMKATELRIGNLLLLPNNQPVEISIDSIKEIKSGIHPYEFIPLTEKWLLRFGFTFNGDWLQLDFFPRMGIRFYNGNYAECDIIQDDKYIAFKNGHVQYVHQLQNLYFALTGEELITN